jgi:acetyl esterase/lipase
MKNIFYSAVLMLCLFVFVPAQDFTLPLWSGAIPNYQETDEREIRDTTDIVRIRYVQKPSIAVYLPAKKIATGQAVIICPGGGYWILAYDWEGIDIAKWLNSKGIAAVVLKYRLPVSKSNIIRHQSPLLDSKRAMRLVRHHAEEWNINPDKVGVMGFSAGGHLASTLGTHFDLGISNTNDPIDTLSSRPDFMILIYPVITFSKPFMHEGSRNALLGEPADSALVTYYSNELQVKENTPPTFLIHAGDDQAVPVANSLVFYQALQAKGIPAEMHIYPEGGHGFSLAIDTYYLETWTDRCILWLKRLNRQFE